MSIGLEEMMGDVRSGDASSVCMKCVYCGGSAQGNYAIHRDGFGVGPEVDLCDDCGDYPEPTCEDIWRKLARGQRSMRRSLARRLELRTSERDRAQDEMATLRAAALRVVEARDAFDSGGFAAAIADLAKLVRP